MVPGLLARREDEVSVRRHVRVGQVRCPREAGRGGSSPRVREHVRGSRHAVRSREGPFGQPAGVGGLDGRRRVLCQSWRPQLDVRRPHHTRLHLPRPFRPLAERRPKSIDRHSLLRRSPQALIASHRESLAAKRGGTRRVKWETAQTEGGGASPRTAIAEAIASTRSAGSARFGRLPFARQSIDCNVTPISLGVGATLLPAACSAAIFSAAVPLPPEMIAPA